MGEIETYKTILVGLPSSGKTTFIAALWHVLRKDDVPGALHLELLEGDDTRLDEIRAVWLAGREQERDRVGTEHYPRLNLIDDDGRQTKLEVPDLSGEAFRDAIQDRRWSNDIDNCVRSADGILLFLHPETITQPVRIDQVESIIEETAEDDTDGALEQGGEEDSENGGEEGEPNGDDVEWNTKRAASQARIVDLLELVFNRQESTSKRRVAIIISAWDVLIRFGVSPWEWLSQAMPLLAQYLEANTGSIDFVTYGVSAFGGNPDVDTETLLDKRKQSERVIVQGHNAGPNDITAPIRWLLSSETDSARGQASARN